MAGYKRNAASYWNKRPEKGSGFNSFSKKQKLHIGLCILTAVIAFVLSIVAIASDRASTSGSSSQVYALAGGIVGVVMSLLVLAHGFYLNQRATKRIIRNERLWDYLTVVAVLLALIFAVSAVAVAT